MANEKKERRFLSVMMTQVLRRRDIFSAVLQKRQDTLHLRCVSHHDNGVLNYLGLQLRDKAVVSYLSGGDFVRGSAVCQKKYQQATADLGKQNVFSTAATTPINFQLCQGIS